LEEVNVVGNNYPAWLPHLATLGLRPTRVHVTNENLTTTIQSDLPESCLCSWGPLDWTTHSPTAAKLLLIDGKACNDALAYAERQGIRLIVATEGRRKSPSGWVETKLGIDHAAVGGVTAKVQRVFVYDRDVLDYTKLDIDCTVPRDASTVLIEKIYAAKHMKAPTQTKVVPLAVEAIGKNAQDLNIYHGGGLLPSDVSTKTMVLTPYLYSRKGTWGLRKISAEELCMALDIPEELAKGLSSTMDKDKLPFIKPGKCLREGLRGVLRARKSNLKTVWASDNSNPPTAEKCPSISRKESELKRQLPLAP
jgi:hypothetical protein